MELEIIKNLKYKRKPRITKNKKLKCIDCDDIFNACRDCKQIIYTNHEPTYNTGIDNCMLCKKTYALCYRHHFSIKIQREYETEIRYVICERCYYYINLDVKKEYYIIKNVFKLDFCYGKKIYPAYYYYVKKEIYKLCKKDKNLNYKILKKEAWDYSDNIVREIEEPENNLKIINDRINNLNNINFIHE